MHGALEATRKPLKSETARSGALPGAQRRGTWGTHLQWLCTQLPWHLGHPVMKRLDRRMDGRGLCYPTLPSAAADRGERKDGAPARWISRSEPWAASQATVHGPIAAKAERQSWRRRLYGSGHSSSDHGDGRLNRLLLLFRLCRVEGCKAKTARAGCDFNWRRKAQ